MGGSGAVERAGQERKVVPVETGRNIRVDGPLKREGKAQSQTDRFMAATEHHDVKQSRRVFATMEFLGNHH